MSAAPQEIVEPLAISLGMTARDRHAAARSTTACTPASSTGRSATAQGKVEAIRELARFDGLDLAQCYAYSDSASDLPMLSAVGHPVAVNPDSKLERHARSHGWPVVIFSQRTKTVIRRTVAGIASAGLAAGTFAAGIELGTRRARRRWL